MFARLTVMLLFAVLLACVGCVTTTPVPESDAGADASDPVDAASDATLEVAVLVTEPLTLRLGRFRDYLFLPVRINDREVGDFMIDTGSNLNVITNGQANRLELPETTRQSVTGVAGREIFTNRRIESIDAGGLRLTPTELAGLNLSRINRYDRVSISGILGVHAFNNHPFTIDYQRNTLTLYPRGGFTPPPGAVAQRYVDLAGLAAIPAIVGDDLRILLLVDTGAGQSVAMPERAAYHPGVLAIGLGGHSRTAGIGGVVAGSRSWLSKITVLGQTLTRIDVSLEPAPPGLDAGDVIIGRIGNELLKNWRLTFVPDERTIYAQWQP